ncbi:hypothetical protein [Leucobacter triazinivorans]|uniref:Uncharacterized protein n=1 Tax=Leucobacter triazinivorans TaxID=1784719 RepID=A0A4P6KDB1_9MICO|nr:hypothetical protein [Leucobacter triazinivorans]QBE47901.1 hypothetical protein EVS81_02885 [Leucobacter triazinivorans]
MSIGKYVTNPGVIGAALGAVSTARRTQSMRQDWRRWLVWGAWLAGLALAIASVAMHEQDAEFDSAQNAERELAKRRKKQRGR